MTMVGKIYSSTILFSSLLLLADSFPINVVKNYPSALKLRNHEYVQDTNHDYYYSTIIPDIKIQDYYIQQAQSDSDTDTSQIRRQTRLKRLKDKNKQLVQRSLDTANNDSSFTSVEKDIDNYQNLLGPLLKPDRNQRNVILSDAPAILIESGPGTGKTTVLAGRIAHLLRSKQTNPHNMIILSFTNRDATALKKNALNMLYPNSHKNDDQYYNSIEKKLWSGTIHSFAISILQKFANNLSVVTSIRSTSTSKNTKRANIPSLRIVSTKEIQNRLRHILKQQFAPSTSSRESILNYQKALDASRQNVNILIQGLMRCIELWKEADVVPSPFSYNLYLLDDESENSTIRTKHIELQKIEEFAKENCIELAMRLGISIDVANLALHIFNDYQMLHVAQGTADPSDVANIAYDFFQQSPDALYKIRSALHHIIVDEYQDLSVSQHKLLRLIVRGLENDKACHDNNYILQNNIQMIQNDTPKTTDLVVPVLVDLRKNKSVKEKFQSFAVPKITCAGDGNQSIYGWRGASPYLTIDRFRVDFPQGINVPLLISYRLPRHILTAANVLIGKHNNQYDTVSTFHSSDVSPSALKSLSTLLDAKDTLNRNKSSDINEEMYLNQDQLHVHKDLALKYGIISESSSSVLIQGLWDAREEANFIASMIRKRSKERSGSCLKALNELKGDDSKVNYHAFFDPTDVAIMVRTSVQMKLIEEALITKRIPYIIPSLDDNAQSNLQPHQESKQNMMNRVKKVAMKPVKLMTMHRAKGDEFDDVYLASWTEGVFPHPSSVATNRLHEERRIAYVCLTRARQRVVLTYSLTQRVAYFDRDGLKKEVTEQIVPSRFLYDLMPNLEAHHNVNSRKNSKGDSVMNVCEGIEWSDKVGFKEVIAGRNLPPHFAKSYREPNNLSRWSRQGNIPKRVITTQQTSLTKTHSPEAKPSNIASTITSANTAMKLKEVSEGLESIFSKERGSCNRYRGRFLSMLKEIGVVRGNALIIANKEKRYSESDTKVDALLHIPMEDLVTKPLSRCTAKELGLYFVYMLLKNC